MTASPTLSADLADLGKKHGVLLWTIMAVQTDDGLPLSADRPQGKAPAPALVQLVMANPTVQPDLHLQSKDWERCVERMAGEFRTFLQKIGFISG